MCTFPESSSLRAFTYLIGFEKTRLTKKSVYPSALTEMIMDNLGSFPSFGRLGSFCLHKSVIIQEFEWLLTNYIHVYRQTDMNTLSFQLDRLSLWWLLILHWITSIFQSLVWLPFAMLQFSWLLVKTARPSLRAEPSEFRWSSCEWILRTNVPLVC